MKLKSASSKAVKSKSAANGKANVRHNPPMPLPPVIPHQENYVPKHFVSVKKQSAHVVEICNELRVLQRHRSILIKSRIMQANRLQAIVAGTIGYNSGLIEKERMAKFKEANDLIKKVVAGEADTPLKPVIIVTMKGIDEFLLKQTEYEKGMLKLVKQLPVSKWVELQVGFGQLNLAIIIGECGDLSNYSSPAKVWKRMGLAPQEFDGKVAMGSTWRYGKEGKLPAEVWESFGYSPRRRSIAYLLGECLIKQNHDIYRKRYDEAKARFAAFHPDYMPGRCHRHGMLLTTKMALRNLWMEWNR